MLHPVAVAQQRRQERRIVTALPVPGRFRQKRAVLKARPAAGKTAFAVWAVFNSLFSARKRRRGPNIALVVGKPPEKGDSDLAALSSSLLSRQRPGQAAASFPAERHAPCSRALRATRCACQQGASDARHGSRCRRCAARRHCPPGNDKDLETYFHVEKRGPFVIACPHATLRIARGPRAQASLIVRPKADGCR